MSEYCVELRLDLCKACEYNRALPIRSRVRKAACWASHYDDYIAATELQDIIRLIKIFPECHKQLQYLQDVGRLNHKDKFSKVERLLLLV